MAQLLLVAEYSGAGTWAAGRKKPSSPHFRHSFKVTVPQLQRRLSRGTAAFPATDSGTVFAGHQRVNQGPTKYPAYCTLISASRMPNP